MVIESICLLVGYRYWLKFYTIAGWTLCDYALLDTLGSAQENAEIIRQVVKLVHKHADAMEKETAVESSMLDDNEVRQYLDLVIRETRGKKGWQNSRRLTLSLVANEWQEEGFESY